MQRDESQWTRIDSVSYVRRCGIRWTLLPPIREDLCMPGCTHLDQIQYFDLPENVEGCEECLVSGDRWVHLRMCQSCGHIGCCDSSPNRHASAHARETEHPIVRSAQPGEEWSWCYVDEIAFIARPQ